MLAHSGTLGARSRQRSKHLGFPPVRQRLHGTSRLGKDMEQELAKHVVITGFRSASTLQELIPLLKKHCDPAIYEQYAKAISSVSAEISMEILNPIFQQYPEIKQE